MIYEVPELTPEERKLPVSKYYDMPVHPVNPLYERCLNMPLDPKDALKVEDWLDFLQMPGDYIRPPFGYCKMEDGSGYIAHWSYYENSRPEMMKWFFRWINIPCKHQPEGCGNIRYKIWFPTDHFTHGFINGKDKTDGIFTTESLDLHYGSVAPYTMMRTVRYPLNLRDYGLSEEKEKKLNEAGVWIDPAIVKFYKPDPPYEPLPSTSLFLTMSRPYLNGCMEKVSIEWVGYDSKDGGIFFDESTPDYKVSNEYMKMALTHSMTEAQHLGTFLPQLYEEYSVKPDDAD